MSKNMQIGIVGLVIMGSAFTRNILKDGFTVHGHDIDPANVDMLAQLGGKPASLAKDVANKSDVVTTSLPSISSFHAVMSSNNGILSSNKNELIVVECSTLSIEDKTIAHDKLAEASITLLDCLISGAGAQAATKDLMVYVSSDENAGKLCQHVLTAMARKTFYVGKFGNGSRMKFVANVLVLIHNIATAEAMVMAMKAGLDPAMTVDVIKAGAGNSKIFELRAPVMVKDDYTEATMKMDVWQKDIDVISDFANLLGCPYPLFGAGTVI